jgi:formylglycine-generating enzyme required for sulfatase activity
MAGLSTIRNQRLVFVGLIVVTVLSATALTGAQDSNDEDELLFTKLDLTEDGFLSGKEAVSVAQYDADGNGKITKAEFLAGRKRDRTGHSGQLDEQAFHDLDINEDGRLSGSELKTVSDYDTDGDRRVTKAEFLAGRFKEREQPLVIKPKPVKPVLDPKLAAWNRQLAAQFDAGDKWAVLIGVDRYEKLNPLRYCVADARLLMDSLVKNCGYPQSHILLLTDDQADRKFHPTKNALQNQVADFLSQVEDRDTVLFFFTGHGNRIDGQSVLAPMDFDPADANASCWRADELRTMLHECRAAQKLLVLDSCHSGGAISTVSKDQTGLELGAAFELAHGLITLASCRTNEESLESSEIKHGLFTYALTRALQGVADFDQNEIVDSDELYRNLLLEVPITAQQVVPGHKQTPVRIIGEDVVGVFAISRPNGPVPNADFLNRPKPGETFVNSIGMKLVFVPPGVFTIGSDENEHTRNIDEIQQPVAIASLFHMGVYEVTQAEYLAVMGENPSYFSVSGDGSRLVKEKKTDRFPVEQISWEDAVEFCRRLSQLPAEQKARRAYRLPTEAEWEYACRANTTTPFHTGELISYLQANVRGDRPFLDAPEGPFLGRTVEVGSYEPNAFGLYDMHGNVAEWCLDWYEKLPYSFINSNNTFRNSANGVLTAVNPAGPPKGDRHLVRGGTFSGNVGLCRSAARTSAEPDYRFKGYGFRVVCVINARP